jgi:DNA-binding response OmpR family regulator
LRILVAEDHPDIADTVAFILQEHGHIVEVARDGFDALKLAASFQPDVILLDIGIPGLDGYEVARQIRQQMGMGVALIALTAWAREEDKQRAINAGMDCHLAKPPDFEMLMRRIAELNLQKQGREWKES